jgi:recombination associated protein RdgC
MSSNWFKNLFLYRIPSFPFGAEAVAAACERRRHTPCGSFQPTSFGFTHTRDERYLWTVEGEHMLTFRMSKKVLPGKVVKEEVERLAVALEKEQGFRPGKKMRKELKERAIEDLMPRAFEVSRDIRVWLSPKRGLLVVDTGSRTVAEEVMKALVRGLAVPFTIVPAKYIIDAAAAMTSWIAAAEPPDGFAVDSDQTVIASGMDSGANIKYSHIPLPLADVQAQIEAGRRVITLALTYEDRASFILTGSGAIKRIEPVGVVKLKGKEAQNPDAQDADMLLMTGTLGELIAAVSECLNGFQPIEDLFAMPPTEPTDAEKVAAVADLLARRAPEVEPDAAADDDKMGIPDDEPVTPGERDPLFAEAQAHVHAQQRASISNIQRTFMIGYNRAARILDELEAAGVVSAMDTSGVRRVIGRAA